MDSGRAFGTHAGKIDDIWMYNRRLKSCEVEARYYTSEYALSLQTKVAASAHLQQPLSSTRKLQQTPSTNPFPLDWQSASSDFFGISAFAELFNIPDASSLQEASSSKTSAFSIEAWIHPYDTEGLYTIARSKNENELSFYMVDGSLALSVSAKTCDCSDTECLIKHEHVADKAIVLPFKWTHVAASYDGVSTYKKMAFYIDGILRETKAMSGSGKEMDSGGLTMIADPGFKNLTGLVYSLAAFDTSKTAQAVVAGVSCPFKDTKDLVSFDESTALDAGDLGSLVNMSYSEPVDLQAMTLNLETPVVSGTAVPVTAVARSTCGKLAMAGGLGLSAVLSKGAFQTAIELTDTNDGNYHGSLNTTGLECGDYKLTVSPGNLVNVPVTIAPGETVSAMSQIVVPQSVECFDVARTVSLVAKDANGCPVVSGTDEFKIHVTGPHSETLNTTYTGADGIYSATFTPQVAGSYSMSGELVSGPAPEMIGMESASTNTKYVCMEVCQGYSREFDGTGNLVFSESSTADLDLAFDAITIEFWMHSLIAKYIGEVGPPPYPYDAALLYKRDVQYTTQQSLKGYSITLDGRYETLTVSFYTSLGEYRTTSVPFLALYNDDWNHIAITYTGTELKVYLNGNRVSTKIFETDRKLHSNPYDSALTIGDKFHGLMDEIKFWSKALTEEEVLEAMHCPPYNKVEDLVAYFHFNEEKGAIGSSSQATGIAYYSFPSKKSTQPTPLFGYDMNPINLAASIPQSLGSGKGTDALSVKYSNVCFFANTYEVAPLAQLNLVSIGSLDIYGGLTTRPEDMKYSSTNTVVLDGMAINVGTSTPEDLADLGQDLVSKSTNTTFVIHARDQCGYHYTKMDPGAFQAAAVPLIKKISDPTISSVDVGVEFPIFTEDTPQEVPVTTNGFVCSGGNPSSYPSVSNEYYGTVDVESTGQVKVTVTAGGSSQVAESALKVVPGEPKSISIDKKYAMASGLLGSLDFSVLDAGSNVISTEYEMDVSFIVGMTQYSDMAISITFTDGHYKLYFIPPVAGVYAITIKIKDLPSILSYELITVQPGPAKPVIPFGYNGTQAPTYEDFETGSGGFSGEDSVNTFEFASVVKGTSLFTFGGATRGGHQYSNQVWELENYDMRSALESKQLLGHMKRPQISGGSSEGLSVVVEVVVDTLSEISAGKMTSTCSDMYFVSSNDPSIRLDHHINAYPGCGTSNTLVYVKVPTRILTESGSIDLFHGGNLEQSLGSLGASSASIFAYHADFDFGGSSVTPKCNTGTLQRSNSDKAAYDGTRSLEVTGSGDSLVTFGYPGYPGYLGRYKLEAFLYDTGLPTSAYHFVSLNNFFASANCTLGQDFISHFANPLIAFGIHTNCHASKYCIYNETSWTSSQVPRYPHWVHLEAESDGITLQLKIDGTVVLATTAVPLSAAYLSSGAIADQSSTAFWDAISVLEKPETAPLVTEATYEGPGYYSPLVRWKQTSVSGAAPPRRLGHTALMVSQTGMAIFGGERNTHLFGDLWTFNFDTQSWSIVQPYQGPNSQRPKPRYDHVAFMSQGDMYIHGGLTHDGEVLDDLWYFNFAAKEWKQVAESQGAGELSIIGGRFGHSVGQAPDGTLYVFGGYGAGGPTNDFFP